MIKITKSRSLPMVIGILTAAVLLQGCQLRDDPIRYIEEDGIPDQVVQERKRLRFPIGACSTAAGTVQVFAIITQSDPLPSRLNVIFRQLDPDDNLLREEVFTLNVNMGLIFETFPFSGICLNPNDQLSVSVQPLDGSIAVGADILYTWSFPNN
jgi:hypothetical protein